MERLPQNFYGTFHTFKRIVYKSWVMLMSAKKSFFAFIVIVAIATAGIYVISRHLERDHGAQAVEPGALPSWHAGNQWVYRTSAGSNYTYTMSREENLDGTPCYHLSGTISPPFEGWGGNTWRLYENATLDLRMIHVYDTDRAQTWRLTYSYSADPWPLSVGKTYTRSSTGTIDYMSGGDAYMDSLPPHTLTITVENIESITVPAGTFSSFKIVAREGGTTVETRWYGDTVKNDVKRIDHQTGEVWELSSYSV